jgi:integrative and conjugative element protein (TIGR02256 family)
MLYDNPGRGTILFTPNTVRMFELSRQRSSDQPESGGYLFGQLFGDQLVISVATPPGPGDTRKPRFIKRVKERGQLLLDRIWRASRGTQIMVGEWHTHFEVKPRPSRLDMDEAKKALKKNISHLDFMVIVIIGSKSVSNLWVGIMDSKGLVKVDRIGYKLWNDTDKRGSPKRRKKRQNRA